jgi:hypothetical protein
MADGGRVRVVVMPYPGQAQAASVVFRTEMDFGHHQRFGATLGLSEDSDLTRKTRKASISSNSISRSNKEFDVTEPTRFLH